MKKVQEKRRIIRTMTESQIRDLGMSLWMKRKTKIVSALLIVCFAWMVGVQYFMDSGDNVALIAIVPVVVFLICGYLKVVKEGNRLWKNIKDKEEPIDLG